MVLKRFVLNNFKVKKIYENANYEYVATNDGIIFALAKEDSGCVSCVFGTLEYFKKIREKKLI